MGKVALFAWLCHRCLSCTDSQLASTLILCATWSVETRLPVFLAIIHNVFLSVNIGVAHRGAHGGRWPSRGFPKDAQRRRRPLQASIMPAPSGPDVQDVQRSCDSKIIRSLQSEQECCSFASIPCSITPQRCLY